MQYSFSKFFSMQVYFSCFLIKGRERGKKESGDSSVNVICSCGLPARCCQLAVAGGTIDADLRSDLNTHLALQALFTQEFSCVRASTTSFPLSKHTGRGDTDLLSLACMFIYSSHEKWVFPSLLWSFHPTNSFTSFSAPD
jgi:hypothetical protein